MKVLFFHHAGGDRYSLAAYKKPLLERGWQPLFYELPGHGDRYNERLLEDIGAVTEDVWAQVQGHLTGPYCIVGNSMGSLLGYCLIRKLLLQGRTPPVRYFGISRKAPDAYLGEATAKHLDDEAFWAMIRAYGGATEVIDHPEMRKFYEPLMRADFNVLQSYLPEGDAALPVPATIIYGKQDRYSETEMNAWKHHFQETEIVALNGGHFIAMDRPSEILEIITTRLMNH